VVSVNLTSLSIQFNTWWDCCATIDYKNRWLKPFSFLVSWRSATSKLCDCS